MQPLTDQGRQAIDELSRRFGVSTEAVTALLHALIDGNGTMAQFHHPELGGSGQWMRGGMTMVGDLFDQGLRAKVDGLCSELSQLLARRPFVPDLPGGRSPVQVRGVRQQQRQSWPSDAATPAAGPAGLFVPPVASNPGRWWPAELGRPSASGAQDRVRYAYFSRARGGWRWRSPGV